MSWMGTWWPGKCIRVCSCLERRNRLTGGELGVFASGRLDGVLYCFHDGRICPGIVCLSGGQSSVSRSRIFLVAGNRLLLVQRGGDSCMSCSLSRYVNNVT